METEVVLQKLTCRHCGAPSDIEMVAGTDYHCSRCDHYQDSMICPTCKSVVRASLMAAGVQPEPHAPEDVRE